MIWFWVGFLVLVVALLALHRRTATLAMRTSVRCAGWVALGLGFTGFVYLMYEHAWLGATLTEPSDQPGTDAAVMFVSAYLLELTLSFDNIIVIALLFHSFRVPPKAQPHLVFWGLVASTASRLVILSGAGYATRHLVGVICLLGGYLAYQGIKLIVPDENAAESAEHSFAMRTLRRFVQVVDGDHDGSPVVIRNGRRVLTRIAVCLVAVVLAEFTFALDATASLSISKTMFIVITSNILATLASSRLCPALGNRPADVRRLRFAAALMFLIAGAKLFAQNHLQVPHGVLLACIASILGVSIALSLLPTPGEPGP